jgi:hypothetical protein
VAWAIDPTGAHVTRAIDPIGAHVTRSLVALLVACAAPRAPVVAPDPVRVLALVPQPALVETVEASPGELARTLAGTIASLVVLAQATGVELVGPPFSRYLARGDRFVVEVGVPIRRAPPGSPGGDVRVGELPGGTAAAIVHVGPHARLGDAYATLDRWLVDHHRREAGPRWEVYLTDPDAPGPPRTEVFAPLDGGP